VVGSAVGHSALEGVTRSVAKLNHMLKSIVGLVRDVNAAQESGYKRSTFDNNSGFGGHFESTFNPTPGMKRLPLFGSFF
jgi:hypothetical protein